MARTIRETLAANLTLRGCKMIAQTERRWTMQGPKGVLYFLGANGGLRYGRSVSHSTSLQGSKVYTELLLAPYALSPDAMADLL